MSGANQPEDLIALVEDLKRRLEILERSNRLTNASIKSPGVLTLVDANGNQVAYFGGFSGGTMGFVFKQPNGTPVIQVPRIAGGGALFINDKSGNESVSTDEVSAFGLARPWVPVPFAVSGPASSNWPTLSNTSYTEIYAAQLKVQHPRLWVQGQIILGGGVTQGRVRVFNKTDNAQIGAEQSFAGASYFTFDLDIRSLGHFAEKEIAVQARVSGGAGSINVLVYGMYGKQT